MPEIRNTDGTFAQIDTEQRKYVMRLTEEEREIILKLREKKDRKGVVGSLRRIIHV